MNKSKREKQRQVREQKQAAAKRKQNLLRYAIIALGIFLVAAVAMTFLQNVGLNIGKAGEVLATDRTKGFSKSPLTLVEYSDFQCPACRAQHNAIRGAWKDIRRKVNLVYRHYPLSNIHPHAHLAAQYAEAAGQQNKFWEYHDQLFDNQHVWSKKDDPTELFEEYAGKLKLDLAQLKADLQSDEVQDKVRADIASGRDAGVRSTPTLFLNGELLSNVRDQQSLTDQIENAWDLAN